MPRPRRLRRRVGLLALGYAALAVAVQPATPATSADGSGLMQPGETIRVSGGDEPEGVVAGSPAITDDGRLVAYQQTPSYYGSSAAVGSLSSEEATEVMLGDLGTGRTERISPAGVVAGVPSISADGRLVAFTQTTETFTGGSSRTTDVYVVDRAGPDGPVTHRVTTRPRDLRYQRAVECDPDLYSDEDDDTAGSCGAELSGDGRSIAIPVKQSVVSQHLRFDVLESDSEPLLDGGAHGLAAVQIREPEPSPYTDPPYRRTVQVTITGSDPVLFTGVTVSSDGSLRLGSITPPPTTIRSGVGTTTSSPSCAGGRFDPGYSCWIVVEFTPKAGGCGTTYGMLTLDSPTPAGQSAIALVGDHHLACTGTKAKETGGPGACPQHPTGWNGGERPAPSGDETINQHERRLGEAVLHRQVLENTSSADRTVTFSSPDCSVQLLDLEPGEEDPETCTPGMTLTPESSCMAYVSLSPTSVGPLAATLTVSSAATGGSPVRVRFVGAGVQPTIVVRRDPSGTGAFGCTCTPRARVASVDAEGRPTDGEAPSISTDGRYVAFVTGLPHGNPVKRYHQVYVHDTDRRGDRSWQPGRSTNVSVVTGDDGPRRAPIAVQPSLSGDGNRIAFVTQEPGMTLHESQVHVRDLVRGETRPVSVPTDSSVPAKGFSYGPSLSRDGSTVAFTSSSRELVPEDARTEGAQVFVRDLGPDFDGTAPARTDIISLRAYEDASYEWGGQAATDADGGIIAFTFMDSLAAPDETFTDTVYVRARLASPAVRPEALSFPVQEVGTVGPPRVITLSNDGPGPIPPISVTVDGPFRVQNGCADGSLHRGETCRVELSFAPTAPGPVHGRAVLNTSANYVLPGEAWTGAVFEIGLTGTAVPLMFRLEPGRLRLPGTGIGTVGRPVRVTARNTSGVPMGITAGFADDADQFRVVRLRAATARPARAAAAPDDCATLAPGGTCTLTVAFTPTALGEQTGVLLVTATVAGTQVSQSVALSAATAEPEFEFQPTVAREGRVVFVQGRNFLPGEPVELVWSSGIVSAPEVVPDAAGEFSAPVVLLQAGEPGMRALTLTMPGIGSFASEPLLVVLGSLQPPDFVSRN